MGVAGLVKNIYLYTYNSLAKTNKAGILVHKKEKKYQFSKKKRFGRDAATLAGYSSLSNS
jgi:hypothetical protein